MSRATHGVHTGTWYYEASITDQPEGSATRIGWSQMLGEFPIARRSLLVHLSCFSLSVRRWLLGVCK